MNSQVNPNSYAGVDFLLTLPTIDHVTRAVSKFGKNSFIAKIDISRAFKHVPIDPRDVKCLGLHWISSFCYELALVFGFHHGSTVFQRIYDFIRFILTKMAIIALIILMTT